MEPGGYTLFHTHQCTCEHWFTVTAFYEINTVLQCLQSQGLNKILKLLRFHFKSSKILWHSPVKLKLVRPAARWRKMIHSSTQHVCTLLHSQVEKSSHHAVKHLSLCLIIQDLLSAARPWEPRLRWACTVLELCSLGEQSIDFNAPGVFPTVNPLVSL